MEAVDLMLCGGMPGVDGRNDRVTEEIQQNESMLVCWFKCMYFFSCVTNPDELSHLSCRLISLQGSVPLLMKSFLPLLPFRRLEDRREAGQRGREGSMNKD